jgi:hypothetical protein
LNGARSEGTFRTCYLTINSQNILTESRKGRREVGRTGPKRTGACSSETIVFPEANGSRSKQEIPTFYEDRRFTICSQEDCTYHTSFWQLILCTIEVLTAVAVKNAVFWDVMPRGSSENRRFGGNVSPPSSG